MPCWGFIENEDHRLPAPEYKLTVLVPGIREWNWWKVHKSVDNAMKGSWEIIFIGPNPPPVGFGRTKNVTYIEDWGTPIRCQQLGLLAAKGEWITWAADDGRFVPGSLERGFEILRQHGEDYKTVVMGKYIEGNDPGKVMRGTDYYILSKHDVSRLPYIPEHYFMLNVGLVSRNLLLEIGGWDCRFEVCPMSYNDLAIRLQNYGAKFIVQDELMFECAHMPGHEGDHGPIHDAQTEHDQPLFSKIYSDPASAKRTTIDLANWVDIPKRWERRFGKELRPFVLERPGEDVSAFAEQHDLQKRKYITKRMISHYWHVYDAEKVEEIQKRLMGQRRKIAKLKRAQEK